MKTTADFKKMKESRETIAMLTAYDYPSAKISEGAGIDLILVGDSVGMVALGYDSTVPVTMDDMVIHTKAVKRGAPNTFIVTDLPFLTYHSSFNETLSHAGRLLQEAGAHAVKLEGGADVIMHIQKLTAAGIPVMGHLGLTPQSVGVLGGYKVQARESESANLLVKEAKAIEQAGAFSLVLECVPQQLTEIVSKELSIPVIGIGAGGSADGQVLVYHDVIGYGSEHVPKFVKQYANIGETINEAIQTYVADVKGQQFPEQKHSFNMKEEQLAGMYGGSRS
ncbi:3-methyl-2-oxobutanoate hydroxymethyltransferase [Guptibacillus hwajinpoensis]|uniref:3-methyl-2-oxobutanoate hydroxymethyltransferase n=1 Tax=Guptibacillus hwajinpoensis TaxID=208199 RepID=A0ABU0JY66_9BACL|nr:3-methyl-2-oxobutanoate hydroxymethyltransferase [Alkalihalobacillus hemicentroti]MDQ0482010.1 3-methyl-2-oxobutanoate hydroxymethyltransferase [Alkalihalobacillus hemicentroti]